jgi:protein-S-isoprenylcysteine O-methyltransferase Ste14
MESAGDILAFAMILFWMVIPLFWIPVHFATAFFRRLGLFSYVIAFVMWLPLAFIFYRFREPLLAMKIDMPAALTFAGATLFVFGTLLHLWTAQLLSLKGILGVPEVTSAEKGRLVTTGAFSVVRHPTYLAHTLMFLGAFLMTGVVAVGIVTVLDFVAVNLAIIPLEEHELLQRFGTAYEQYGKKVPRFFPRIRSL